MTMDSKLAEALDESLEKSREKGTICSCITENEAIRKRMEPLLYTGLYISSLPKISPSEEFQDTARERLTARLQREEQQAKNAVPEQHTLPTLLPGTLVTTVQRLWQSLAGMKKVAVPVTLGLVLVIATMAGASSIFSPSPTIAAGCTLSILGGSVDVYTAEIAQAGTEGMTLEAGTRVVTGPDSQALLTFFDGSTLKLEPGTNIEIEQLEISDDEDITIVMKQWMGKTWSRVVKMADTGSRYEIQTPSAVALVRGTQFSTEVNNAGETQVLTIEGLVSVFGEDDEVYVPAGKKTRVVTGAPPHEPEVVPEDEYEEQQAQANSHIKETGQYGVPAGNQGNAPGHTAYHAQGQVNAAGQSATNDHNAGQQGPVMQNNSAAGNTGNAADDGIEDDKNKDKKQDKDNKKDKQEKKHQDAVTGDGAIEPDEAAGTENESEPPEDESEPPEDESESPEDESESPENESEPPEDESEPPEDESEPPENEPEPPENEPEPPEDESDEKIEDKEEKEEVKIADKEEKEEEKIADKEEKEEE